MSGFGRPSRSGRCWRSSTSARDLCWHRSPFISCTTVSCWDWRWWCGRSGRWDDPSTCRPEPSLGSIRSSGSGPRWERASGDIQVWFEDGCASGAPPAGGGMPPLPVARTGIGPSGRAPGGGVPSPACRGGAYVYILESLSTGKFYIGATAELQRRLDRHAQSTTAYTRSERPWRLVGYEVYPTMREARAREHTLKRNPRMRFFFVKRALAGPHGCAIVAPRAGR